MGDFEDYKEIAERQNKSSYKFSQNIKPIHVAIFVGIFLIVNQIIKTNKNNTFLYIVLGCVFLIYVFSNLRGGETSKVIPRGLAQKIALQDLKSEMRPNGSYPLGTKINSTSFFKDQSIDTGDGMKLFKYNIGFSIQLPNQSQKEIIYQMAPFTGECKGIIEMPMGFTGEDIKDIQLVYPETTKTESKPNN